MLNITSANYEKEIKESTIPVIVDFWAEWCGPCRMMGPVFEELAPEYDGKLKFAKVNTDEEQLISQNAQIRGIPCLIIYKNGEEFDRIVGFLPKPQLKQQIDSILARM